MVAIETATETVGVAVRTPVGVEAEFALTGRRRHVETLTPALEHLLAQVDLVPADLGVVAVDVGPGLFTGLRVGVAAAKALAQSLGIGVLGATSLDILTAAAARGRPRRPRAGLRRRPPGRGLRVGARARCRGDSEWRSSSHRACSPRPGWSRPWARSAARGLSRSATVRAATPRRWGRCPASTIVSPGLSFPPPATLLRLAATRLAEGEPPVEPDSVVPLYMREADARSNFARVERM